MKALTALGLFCITIAVLWWMLGNATVTISSVGYRTIQVAGSALTERRILNFIAGTGQTISCVDNSGSTRTDCTFTASGGSGGGYATIQASGTALTQRTILNFQPGTAIIASDDAGNTRTNVTLDVDLIALAELASTGCLGRTGSGALTAVSLTQPAAGLTISPSNCSANMVFALADDLAALEGLSTNGIAVRTATSSWTTLAPTESLIPVATGTTWTTAQIQDCIGEETNNDQREVNQYNSTSHTFSCDSALPDIGDPIQNGLATIDTIPGISTRGTTTAAVANNALYYFPFYVFTDMTVDTIAYEVTATAAATCRTGLYEFSELMIPGALVIDAGTFTPTTTGRFQLAITGTALSGAQGRYAAALVCSGTPTFRSIQGAYLNPLLTSNTGSSRQIEELRRASSGGEVTALSNPGLAPTASAVNTVGYDYLFTFGIAIE